MKRTLTFLVECKFIFSTVLTSLKLSSKLNVIGKT
jgi:hypothetical protein